MIIPIVILLLQLRYNYYTPAIDFLLFFIVLLSIFSIVITIIASRRIKIVLEEREYHEGDFLSLSIKTKKLIVNPNIKIKITRRIRQNRSEKTIKVNSRDLEEEKIHIETLNPSTYDIDIDYAIFTGLFGVFRVFRRIKRANSFVVYPKPIEFDYKKLPTFKQNGDGITINRKGDDYSEVYEIREFMDGDDMKHLHHSLSAKHDKNMIKVGSKSERTIYIFNLDKPFTFEEIVEEFRKIMFVSQDKKIVEENSFCFAFYKNKWRVLLSDGQIYKLIKEVYRDYE